MTRCGVAEVDITPSELVAMAGYSLAGTTAKGVGHPLFARALYIDDGVGPPNEECGSVVSRIRFASTCPVYAGPSSADCGLLRDASSLFAESVSIPLN